MSILRSTPIEYYTVSGLGVHVKREDTCAPEGWPPFSKLRGLVAYLTRRKAEGLECVAYCDTTISMAGWAVSCAAKLLGLRAIVFCPTFKTKRPDLELLAIHRAKWESNGAETVPIQACRGSIMWARAKAQLEMMDAGRCELLKTGLPFDETAVETAKEWQLTHAGDFASVVCVIGSGVVFSGLLRAWRETDGELYGVVNRDADAVKIRRRVFKRAGVPDVEMLGPASRVHIKTKHWGYTDASEADAPFPCHKYYDRKAWQWLCEHLSELKPPVLFWNIGATVTDVQN